MRPFTGVEFRATVVSHLHCEVAHHLPSKTLRQWHMGMAHKRSISAVRNKSITPKFSTVSSWKRRLRQGRHPRLKVCTLWTFPLKAGRSRWSRPNEIPTTGGLQQRPPSLRNYFASTIAVLRQTYVVSVILRHLTLCVVWSGHGAVQLIQAVEWNKFCQKAFCSQFACFPQAFLDMFLNLVWQPRPLLRQKRGSPQLLAACASPEAKVTFAFSTAFKMNATIPCSLVGFCWSNVWLKILWYKVVFQRFLDFELYWIEACPALLSNVPNWKQFPRGNSVQPFSPGKRQVQKITSKHVQEICALWINKPFGGVVAGALLASHVFDEVFHVFFGGIMADITVALLRSVSHSRFCLRHCPLQPPRPWLHPEFL